MPSDEAARAMRRRKGEGAAKRWKCKTFDVENSCEQRLGCLTRPSREMWASKVNLDLNTARLKPDEGEVSEKNMRIVFHCPASLKNPSSISPSEALTPTRLSSSCPVDQKQRDASQSTRSVEKSREGGGKRYVQETSCKHLE